MPTGNIPGIYIAERYLFARVAEGEEAAFRELYQTYGRQLFPFLVKITRSQDMADELIQETFLRVWLHRDKLPSVEYPRAWLFQVASNLAHSWIRKHLTAGRAEQLHRRGQPEAEETVETTVTLRAIRNLVHQVIEELPPQRKKIYQLHREQGLKPTEIAAELDLSVSTVKNTLQAAAKTIREKLEKAGYAGWLVILLLKL